MVSPLLVQLRQFFKFCLKIVDRFSIRLFGRRIEGNVRGRLSRIGSVTVRFAADGLLLMVHIDRCKFLQHWILLKLLLNKRLQLERRRLKQRQRLLELRSKHLREGHLLRKLQTLSHACVNSKPVRKMLKPNLARSMLFLFRQEFIGGNSFIEFGISLQIIRRKSGFGQRVSFLEFFR